jgi:hypothetical protein
MCSTSFFMLTVHCASKSAAITSLARSRTQYLLPSTSDTMQFSWNESEL